MADIPQELSALLEFLDAVPDRADRIQTLIEIADRFRSVPEEVARRPFTAEHRTPACESEAYVWARPRPDGTLQFYFAVENPQGIAARALAVILDETLSGAPVDAVAEVSGDVVYRIFGIELSMGKSMGLMGMVAMVRESARRKLRDAGTPPAG